MIKRFLKNDLIKGSFILLILFNLFNLLNFIFHFISARLLGPADYGILATLMAMIYIINIPSEAIQTVISRFTTTAYVKKDFGALKLLVTKSLGKFLILGVIGLFIFFIFSGLLSDFFKIEKGLILMLGLVFALTLLTPIPKGLFQGMKKFGYLGSTFFLEGLLKVGLTIFLILIGWKVYGAMAAITMALLLTFLLNLILPPTTKVFKAKKSKLQIKGIYSYSIPVLIAITSITVFYTIDMLLAKRFFGAEVAGLYGAIAMVSKIVFFVSVPISRALFPLASENTDKKKSNGSLTKVSLFLVGLLSLFVLLIYIAFPELVIKILYGSQYLEFSKYLIYPTIAMVILSLTNILIFANLSKKNNKPIFMLPIFVILQIILISLFHQTIMQFIWMLIIGNAITFIYFLISLFRHED